MKKYEQEIRELLDKLENFVPETTASEREREAKKKVVGVMPPAPKPLSPRGRGRTGGGFGQWLRAHNLSVGIGYLIMSFGLLVVALIINQQAPSGFKIIAQILAVVAAVIYLLPIILRVFMGRDINSDGKYWRGQSVEEEPIVNLAKLRQRFGKRGGNGNSNSSNDRNRSNRW